MTFHEVLAHVIAWLQREQRVSYRALKQQLALDDDYLEALKDELIYAKQLAVDEDGRVLVWTGAAGTPPGLASPMPQQMPPVPAAFPYASNAERRQLTVLFCDLVDSPLLAEQLDPEELRQVVRAYHTTCAAVIARFDGYISRYMGDGLLVYFGYPQAHKDAAQRAVRTGLEILAALPALQTRLQRVLGSLRLQPLQMRMGIHTGLVMVDLIGTGAAHEHMALGETPNIAARLQGLATPDTLVISATTYRLLHGFFRCQALGAQTLKGVTTPVSVYRVLGESGAHAQGDLGQGDAPATAAVDVSHVPNAERRQLTVLFCDLVGSTPLAEQLDPEDLRDVVRAYQQTCAEVVQRFDGYIAQYLGDALLVYFGWPQAHEDDAQRALRSGLGMLEAMGTLNTRLEREKGFRLAMRIGIHTGLVVVGEMGGGNRQEQLALGEVPNIAARLQGLAAPDTALISATTYRLLHGFFRCQALGTQPLKGVTTPVPVYRVLGESGVQSRLDIPSPRGLIPLVGRDAELVGLRQHWAQARDGLGQVVILSGEAGIGKSRLLHVLKESVAAEPHIRIEWRCSPYYQHSALYPVITYLHHLLRWRPDSTPQEKLQALEETLAVVGLALPEVVPLLASLLTLPLPERYPPVSLSSQRQKQKTLEALLAWLLAEAARQPVLFIVEDLHWIDPSTLEFLTLLVDQGPLAHILTLLACRPELSSSWTSHAHVTPLTLGRLSRPQVAQMIAQIAGGKALPPAVVEEIITKTDGVPLFVEELTSMILESGLLQEVAGRYELTGPLPPLAIPTTLHDALMARLDRLSTAKAVAQLGATIGRTFAYELLQAMALLDDARLQSGLQQLVDAELVSQHGVAPQATYTFKHALIQDAAYQSLLRGTRQQYHQRLAQVVAERFPQVAETQPELLAHHYTKAGLYEQAIPYWQRAGQQALQRSANLEAVQHLTTGLELLAMLPETPARTQKELDLQIALGPVLIATKGFAAPEVEQTYARARALCAQVGETPQLFPTLRGLCLFYQNRGALPTARELGDQLNRLAQRVAVPTLCLEAHDAHGSTLFQLGEYAAARTHLEQGIALIDTAVQRDLALRHGWAPGVRCLVYAANTLWCLGAPAQAMRRSQESLALAQEIAHPHGLVLTHHWATYLHHRRREVSAVQAQAEALLTLATTQGFPLYIGFGTCWRGWALAMQGQGEVGLAQIRQGLAAVLATGQMLARPIWLTLLAEAAGHAGHLEEGLRLLAEALAAFEASKRGDMLAEVYRLQGTLLLQQAIPDAVQAEACFQHALTIARRQQAKSWELRAAMSVARLWQHQGRHIEAYDLLAPVYGWFTEGFDTADLQEARALLAALS
jgi:class 3 adenylate cyclase/predicted ATPase